MTSSSKAAEGTPLSLAQGKASQEMKEKVVIPEVEDKPLEEEESQTPASSEEKSTEEKPAEETEPEKVAEGTADEEYELEILDGSPLTEEDLNEVAAYAEKYNLTQEEAQKLLSDREKVYQKGQDATMAKAKEVFEAEKQKLLSDPDFKGEKLDDSLAKIDLAVEKIGGEEFREFLKGPAGNSLPLAKFLLKIGNLMASDSFVGKGRGAGQVAVDPQEAAYRKMYPNFFEK